MHAVYNEYSLAYMRVLPSRTMRESQFAHRKPFVPPRENAERHMKLLCVFACHVKAPLTNHVEKASFESDDAPISLCENRCSIHRTKHREDTKEGSSLTALSEAAACCLELLMSRGLYAQH